MTGDDPHAADEPDAPDDPLPEEVREEAVRLTRLAREASADAEAQAYRRERDEIVAGENYRSRVREDDDVLVLHPAEWLEGGTVRTDRVEDVSRGVEIPLSGPGDGDDWEAIDAHNRGLAETVAQTHGEHPHGVTAHALADFASNHYAKPIEALTAAERREFREEYLPRNAWPSDEQRDAAEESVRLVLAAADEDTTERQPEPDTD